MPNILVNTWDKVVDEDGDVYVDITVDEFFDECSGDNKIEFLDLISENDKDLIAHLDADVVLFSPNDLFQKSFITKLKKKFNKLTPDQIHELEDLLKSF